MPKTWKIICVSVVLTTSLAGIGQYYTDPSVQREQWREAVSYIEQEDGQRIALFAFPEPFAPFLWYGHGIVATKGIAPAFHVRDEDLQMLSGIVDGYDRIYLFQYLTGLTDQEGKTRGYLSTIGFNETGVKNFPGVGFIYVYEKSN